MSEKSELTENDIYADDLDSVVGGESLYCTQNDQILRGCEIRSKAYKEGLVTKIITREYQKLVGLKESQAKILKVHSAHEFLLNIQKADDEFKLKKVESSDSEEDEEDKDTVHEIKSKNQKDDRNET